ncbi:MAG: hypothetical protein COY69_02155 [Candidatus Magasanikbacteria bacterium CG_4_10_14_0_8_um_filter_32_14]|uniref:Nucleotidyl transferase AbiEii/AbiGii toxin family protein n=1 Tax=Candidatus Magasanikbacteria bacterium CG_4_10_14_0_8_um_filter_32_14 TaxID=1974640 RepID=A0A2M7R996_9BACT|nr:MAG: hypothetical protein COY69_02155 [Candidatus Magasanikbacteria bacterium CG_4_10_14_0_8_um_filter_32_14]
MHEETLSQKTKMLLDKLTKEKWFKNFYLAGGTALALHYGHRESIDLDWFTPKNIRTEDLLSKLSKVGKFVVLQEEENIVEGTLDGVKVSFVSYPYPILGNFSMYNKVNLVSVWDIALMKLTAISSRNTKKDFIDLYYFLHKEKTNLSGLLAKMKKKYKGINYEILHILKSLVYFVEADKEPMPRMLEDIGWSKVKKFFEKEVLSISSKM